MKKPLYIFKAGTLKRKQNTLFYETSEGTRALPIETIQEIHLFGETTLNTKVIHFLLSKSIPVHFYNFYGTYTGTLYPREQNISGVVIIRQVEHFLNTQKRLFLARRLIEGAIFNMLRILRYYLNRKRNIAQIVQQVQTLLHKLPDATDINTLRGYEGKARDLYYSAWNEILTTPNPQFKLQERTRRPPTNPINALISFGNSLLYATIVAELYAVHLHGGISYVHEPGSYRFSLALDLADIFKPVLVDRLIFNLINHRILDIHDFEIASHYSYLKESGRRLFVQRWQQQMETTIKHPKLRRSVSYRRLIRLECYKLIKHLLGEKEYIPFKMWW